jgi:Uma2 family endonuclease
MAIGATRTTADELLAMPEDGMQRELVLGELRVMVPPGFAHGQVALEIARVLANHVKQRGLGVTVAAETGFLLASDPDTVRAPDAAFISKDRADAVGATAKYWPGPPDLAVEVVSPGDSVREVQETALAWLAAGTIAVLVLDPANQTATIYRGGGEARVHTGDDRLDLSDAVPGFTTALAPLFVSG